MYNKIIIIVYFLLSSFLIATITGAEENRLIEVYEGKNIVTFYIDNNWSGDINNLQLIVDNMELPQWLGVSNFSESISVAHGSKHKEYFKLNIEINKGLAGTSGEIPLRFVDDNGNRWTYNLDVIVGIKNNAEIDRTYMLYGNFPNPFNATTTIEYFLADEGVAKVNIYNSLGQQVRTLIDEYQTAGLHIIKWDGSNDAGEKVSSGVYFYSLISGQYSKTKKMILME